MTSLLEILAAFWEVLDQMKYYPNCCKFKTFLLQITWTYWFIIIFEAKISWNQNLKTASTGSSITPIKYFSFSLYSTANYGHTNAETIGNALVKLLNDGNSEVQISAASNIGKVCIAISQPSSQPRLSLTRSEDSASPS